VQEWQPPRPLQQVRSLPGRHCLQRAARRHPVGLGSQLLQRERLSCQLFCLLG